MAFSRRQLPVDASMRFGCLPDWSRAVNIGGQRITRSTNAQIYNDLNVTTAGTTASEGIMDGVIPFVLTIKYPCYIVFCGISGDSDTDYDHCILYSKNQAVATALVYGLTYGTFANTMKAAPYNANPGVDWWDFGGLREATEGYAKFVPLVNTGWYCRPTLGSTRSENESRSNMTFFIVPLFGTPKDTVLAHRTLFTAASNSSGINNNVTLGTEDTVDDRSTITVKNGSKEITVHQPLKVVAP